MRKETGTQIKMRFEVTLFVLVCLFLCMCNGAPPKKDCDGIYRKYTDEEDNFIIEELSDLLDEYKGLDSRILWGKLLDKHREKYQQGVSGFHSGRSAYGLRSRFKNVLLNHHLTKKRILPERLVQKLYLHHQNKRKRGGKTLCPHSYTKQEDDLIFEELLKPTCTCRYGSSKLRDVLTKLEEKHQEKASGFSNKRTLHSLRSHVYSMRDRHQLPPEVERKLRKPQDGGSSSSSTCHDHGHPTDLQIEVPNEGQDNVGQENDDSVSNERDDNVQQENRGEDDDWIHDMIEELQYNTVFDVDFTKIQRRNND